MPPPARTSSNYLDPAALVAIVTAYRRRRTKARADALGKALLLIAGGVWDRYHFTPDREDFCQDVVVHLLQRPLEKADVQKHLFNYFTTCAIRFGLKLRQKAHGDRRRFETYAAELVEAGRPIPSASDNLDVGEFESELDRPITQFRRRNARSRPVKIRHF
jgi:hypothetical protein